MGPGAADIAEIIPDLRDKLPDLELPPSLDPEQARFRLFDSITTFLKNAAQSQPLMLVLDDLHWADRSSLLLLEFLARHVSGNRLFIVGCYRDMELSRQHPLAETLAQLSREPMFLRHLLQGLSPEDTEHFIQITAGVTPSSDYLKAIYARTEGNPFFMTEVVRLLSDREVLITETGSLPGEIRIPQGVREVIGQRLNRLSEQCNQTLIAASMVGRNFELRLLSRLMNGWSDEQLLTALDEALQAHLIEELPGLPERFQFSHSLVQDTLGRELSAVRQARLHAQIGEALEELYGPSQEAHASELAYHFAEGQSVSGVDKLVRYTLLAGERALAAYAHEEALSYFERALNAKDIQLTGYDAVKDAETADLLFGLGRAQVATLPRHHLGEAETSLRLAFSYYAAAGEIQKAVAVAEYPIPAQSDYRVKGDQLIAQALKLVPSDSVEMGRLPIRYGMELGHYNIDYAGAQEAFDTALAIAQKGGNRALEMQTLAASADVDFYHNHFGECVEKSKRAIELARQAGELHVEVNAQHQALRVLNYLGDSNQAAQHGEVALRLADQLRERHWLSFVLRSNATLYCLLGEWERAGEFVERGLAVEPAAVPLLAQKILLRFEVGAFAEAEAWVLQLLETLNSAPPWPRAQNRWPALLIPLAAQEYGLSNHLDTAERAASHILSSAVYAPFYARYAQVGLAIMAVYRADLALASKLYPALESTQGSLSFNTSNDRVMGLVAEAIGKPDMATEHYMTALVLCRRAGYHPELARTCRDYAHCLLQRNHSGDRDRAISMLRESFNISSELGMRPLMERVVTLQERAESQPTKAPEYPAGLSQREVEVLRLIANGKTDREIADELVISSRTVNNHVRSILNKTAVANRTEAATYASRNGLV